MIITSTYTHCPLVNIIQIVNYLHNDYFSYFLRKKHDFHLTKSSQKNIPICHSISPYILLSIIFSKIHAQVFTPSVIYILFLDSLIIIIKIVMNVPLCVQHAHPRFYVCGESACHLYMCDSCLQQHNTLYGHSLSLTLNNISIDFFIDFSNFLVQTFGNAMERVHKEGFKVIFDVQVQNGKYVFPVMYDNQINRHCLAVIGKYKELVYRNKEFVMKYRDNLAMLSHPQFLCDFSAFLLEKWQIIGNNLAGQLKEQLTRTYPYRLSYKNIKFMFNSNTSNQIQAARVVKLEAIKSHVFIHIDDKYQSSFILQRHLSNQARIQQQIRTVPQGMTIIDSFEQILQSSSYLSLDKTGNLKHILEQSIQTLSPNFLSQEDLQKQIQSLLLRNQALQQENYQLRFQNDQLRQENNQLKQRKNL